MFHDIKSIFLPSPTVTSHPNQDFSLWGEQKPMEETSSWCCFCFLIRSGGTGAWNPTHRHLCWLLIWRLVFPLSIFPGRSRKFPLYSPEDTCGLRPPARLRLLHPRWDLHWTQMNLCLFFFSFFFFFFILPLKGKGCWRQRRDASVIRLLDSTDSPEFCYCLSVIKIQEHNSLCVRRLP